MVNYLYKWFIMNKWSTFNTIMTYMNFTKESICTLYLKYYLHWHFHRLIKFYVIYINRTYCLHQWKKNLMEKEIWSTFYVSYQFTWRENYIDNFLHQVLAYRKGKVDLVAIL
jgi:hypothetical protein